MPEYKELVAKYKKRRRDTLVDAVTTGLSYADNVAADLGLLQDTGVLGEVLDATGNVLPFAVIAISEQAKVIMGRKSQQEANRSIFYRMIKTGAALGAGAAATAVGGVIFALPAAIGTRTLLDTFKSKALTGRRVDQRIHRLQELRRGITERRLPSDADVRAIDLSDTEVLPLEEDDLQYLNEEE